MNTKRAAVRSHTDKSVKRKQDHQGVGQAVNTLTRSYGEYTNIALRQDPLSFATGAAVGGSAGALAGNLAGTAVAAAPMVAGVTTGLALTPVAPVIGLPIVAAGVATTIAIMYPTVYGGTAAGAAPGAVVGSVTGGQLSPNRHVRSAANSVADNANQTVRAAERAIGVPDTGLHPWPKPPFDYKTLPRLLR